MTHRIADTATIRDALSSYYVEHGLPADGGESQPWFDVRIGRVTIPLPNPPARKRAVFYHDVNHVLTGYNTVFTQGEMIIAGFELGCGCGPFFVAWFINFFMIGFGLLFCPRPLFHAFLRGRRSSSVYVSADRPAMRNMEIAQLRAMLRIPREVPAARPSDYLIFSAWALASASALLAPVVLALVALLG